MFELTVSIPDRPIFYSLYSDGLMSHKAHDNERKATLITYPENAALILYYTYPAYREACLVRNTAAGTALLPGLSKKVSLIFSARASLVDKLRRAAAFLHKHSGGAFRFDDGFYIRLLFLISRRGKLNYRALRLLAGQSLSQGDLYADPH